MTGVAEETSSLNQVIPYRVTVELVDASIHLKEIIVSEGGDAPKAINSERLQQQSLNKIRRINENIQQLGQLWVAGETSISRLSYQEKLSMFGGSIPNFQGLEYYVGGVFVLPGKKTVINLNIKCDRCPGRIAVRKRIQLEEPAWGRLGYRGEKPDRTAEVTGHLGLPAQSS